ncbi:MAG: sulfate transporter [Prevotella sp.]|nr:sulfate transporter [Prevotella sp.]
MDNWIYYAAALMTIIVVAYLIKKVTSCMVKSIVFIILLAVLGTLFYAMTR